MSTFKKRIAIISRDLALSQPVKILSKYYIDGYLANVTQAELDAIHDTDLLSGDHLRAVLGRF